SAMIMTAWVNAGRDSAVARSRCATFRLGMSSWDNAMPCRWPGKYDHWLRTGSGNGKQASLSPSAGRDDSRDRAAAVIADAISVITHQYRARCRLQHRGWPQGDRLPDEDAGGSRRGDHQPPADAGRAPAMAPPPADVVVAGGVLLRGRRGCA